jgi:hypothetical protein
MTNTLTSGSRRVKYAAIDIHKAQAEAWPAAIPPLTDAEATKAAQLLYRRFYQDRFYEEKHGMGRLAYYRKLGRTAPPRTLMPVKITSGNRHTWVRRGTISVNTGRGWRHLVHMLSHYCHSRLRPQDQPHSDSHRHLETEMIAWVIGQGWLAGKLKPAARAAASPVVEQHERVLARIKSWETKAKRAATALGKLKQEEAKLRRKRPL